MHGPHTDTQTQTHTDTHTQTHTHTHTYTHTHTHTHTHTLRLSVQPPQPFMGAVYPPNQETLSSLFTSTEFRPGSRSPRRLDGPLTIAGTWVKRPVPSTSTTSCTA